MKTRVLYVYVCLHFFQQFSYNKFQVKVSLWEMRLGKLVPKMLLFWLSSLTGVIQSSVPDPGTHEL